jgi:hypothetical protein
MVVPAILDGSGLYGGSSEAGAKWQRYGEGEYDARGGWSLVFLMHSLDLLKIVIFISFASLFESPIT